MADTARAAPGVLARYTLVREIGRGRQAQVWLAHDPRLDRPVAIKLLQLAGDPQTLAAGLAGARAASRLAHPNIVPIFEADRHQGQSYLVFEYVEGPTLAQALRLQPLRPAAEAVALMLGVLDALQAAHQQGLVHGALRPSNVLLGRDGRPRLMDFGSAAPSLPSPSPAQDVHAAGAMLGELLCGRPLLPVPDGAATPLQDLAADALLPDQPALDSRLRGIVLRALARDLAVRYASAGAMQADLQAWLQPEAAPTAGAVSNHATLEFLLRRMRHRSDFPALSSAVVRIQRVASSDSESVRTLTEEILLDVALTHKLLRLVNTAHYSGLAAGGISTVSRAVALIGFSGIRNMALSLVLLEHMPDRAHATQLTFEFVRALMVGMVAVELAPRGPAGEDAFLGALFQNLGRLLTEYYLPEEAQQIRQQLGNDSAPAAAREALAERVLGIGFDELGAGVARVWGLPETLQRALRAPLGDWPASPAESAALQGVERLRWLGRSANTLVDALQAVPVDPQTFQRVVEAQAPLLGVGVEVVLLAVEYARLRLLEAVQALGLVLPAGSAARRLIEPRGGASESAARDRPDFAGTQSGELSGFMPLSDPAQTLLEDALLVARAAVAERSMGPSEVVHLVLDVLQRALKLRRVVLCLREPGSGGCIVGRLGMGPGGSELSSAFRFSPEATAGNDLFAAICARGADLLVADSGTVTARLPGWYRRHVDAPTFLLLPLMVNGRAMGLIYGDRSRAGSLVLREQDLALVRALRDQVTLAFGRSA
jgi:HD-like signal output (HDOD) protein